MSLNDNRLRGDTGQSEMFPLSPEVRGHLGWMHVLAGWLEMRLEDVRAHCCSKRKTPTPANLALKPPQFCFLQ